MSFCLLDAARMGERMNEAKQLASLQYVCLYKGSAEAKFSHVAPYLFSSRPTAFVDWLFAEGWGQAWGVFVIAEADLDSLHRRFLRVKRENGEPLYFRFYDPRVLRLFLPTCTAQQLIELFGPIRYFLVEDADPAYGINFWLEAGQLRQQRLEKAELQAGYKRYVERQSAAW